MAARILISYQASMSAKVQPAESLRILHISDPQFGQLCEAQPKHPADAGSICGHPLIESFFEHCRTQIQPDLIALTGDISSAAKPTEYLQAESFVEQLRKIWGGDDVPVVVVPGNHDVSWDLDDLHAPTFSGLRFAPFRHFQDETCSSRVSTRHSYRHDACGDFVSFFDSELFTAIGFNTAAKESKSQKPHHGHVSEWQLDEARQLVLNSKGRYRIALLHHHLVPFRDPPDWLDVSTATNAQSLIDFLHAERFTIALHGHRHYPNLRVLVSTTGRCLHVFGAGAFSVVATERITGSIRNFAHWIVYTGTTIQGSPIGELISLKCHGGAGKYSWKPPNRDEYDHRIRLARPLSETEIKHRVAALAVGINKARKVSLGPLLLDDPELAATDRNTLLSEIRSAIATHDLVNDDRDLSEWILYERP